MIFNLGNPREKFSQFPHWETSFPIKGESKIFVGSQVPLGYLYLTSDFWIPEGTSKWYTDGQLVKVKRRQNGYAYLDEPIARTFHAPGTLFQVPVEVGRVFNGGKGPVAATFTAESEFISWEFPDGWDGQKAVDFQACSRIRFVNPIVVGQPLNQNAYGVGFNQCTRISMPGLETRGCRHPLVLWGVGRANFANVVHKSPSGAAGMDFGHGFVEDVLYEGGDGGDREAAFNNRWNAPCSGVTIRGFNNARDLLVYSGSELEVVESKFRSLVMYQNRPGQGMRVDSDWKSFTGYTRRGEFDDATAELNIR